jgi:pyruvate-formate lyase
MIPKIDDNYSDEFGKISTVVYNEAEKLWKIAKHFAEQVLQDEQLGQQLLTKASANVSRILENDPNYVENLSGFLFKSYKRLVLAEAKKRKYRGELEQIWIAETAAKFEYLPHTTEEKLIQQILLTEITSQMDSWTKQVFQLRCLGYEYSELVPKFGKAENVIRSKLSKKISGIAKKINSQQT